MDQSACSKRSCDLSIKGLHVARAVVANQSVDDVMGVMTYGKSVALLCEPYNPNPNLFEPYL